MVKDLVLQLRYLGVIPRARHFEYGFHIEDKSIRLVVLMIEGSFFERNDLMFQEAPDLCYQKVLADLDSETADSRIPNRVPVTCLDVAHYRELHPNTKSRRAAARDSK
jgi:hypothetical protein